jgi:hypothetical protein
VRHWLDRQFLGHVTGRHGRVEWPPRSPDLTLLDCYGGGGVSEGRGVPGETTKYRPPKRTH